MADVCDIKNEMEEIRILLDDLLVNKIEGTDADDIILEVSHRLDILVLDYMKSVIER